MLAIRQVTQLNTGKKTAGIDGKVALNFKERFELENVLAKNAENWKHNIKVWGNSPSPKRTEKLDH